MLEYNEIKPGKFIIYNGEPYEVIEYHVARTQQRKPQNQTKLKSLLSGRVISISFHASDKVSEADISKRPINFVYANRGEYIFSEVKDQSKRFTIDESIIGPQAKFLKGNTPVDALVFTDDDDEEKIIGVKLPIKMELLVKDAPPAIKGNTASGGGKQVTLETGAIISVPLFIEAGETVRVNTETGEYTERVSK
ncbi:MAG: elongation factor P [Candidatus Paceibacterota bacterium]|jgi:elongation factor P